MKRIWKRLRSGLWRRADWAVVRGHGKGTKIRFPDGRYVNRAEFDGLGGSEGMSIEATEADAKPFGSQDDAMAWLDANHPTKDRYEND